MLKFVSKSKEIIVLSILSIQCEGAIHGRLVRESIRKRRKSKTLLHDLVTQFIFFPRNQVLPLSVSTGFCMLSSVSARAQGVRTRLLDWCESHGITLRFGCPLWGLGENGEVFLWAHHPPEPGMEE